MGDSTEIKDRFEGTPPSILVVPRPVGPSLLGLSLLGILLGRGAAIAEKVNAEHLQSVNGRLYQRLLLLPAPLFVIDHFSPNHVFFSNFGELMRSRERFSLENKIDPVWVYLLGNTSTASPKSAPAAEPDLSTVRPEELGTSSDSAFSGSLIIPDGSHGDNVSELADDIIRGWNCRFYHTD
ncbi:MAG: hypothetical protein WC846_04055 [Candidatus Gracilibacteria bacterium]|jgi:hypothetical protein